MKIGIANDHHGIDIKNKIVNYLKEEGYDITNYGTNTTEMVDYPLYAIKIGEAVKNKEIDRGILICGTGIGMSVACNKVKTVVCAKINGVEEAKLAREHNDANVITIGEKLPFEEIKEILNIFLKTPFSKIERYKIRKEIIEKYENEH